MSIETLASQPASLLCLARRQPGSLAEEQTEVALQISGNFGAEALFVYPADLEASVADVKEAISRIEGTPAREQRLLAGNRPICSDGQGGNLDHLPLWQALEQELEGQGAKATVAVTLVRVPAVWAEQREGLQSGRLLLRRMDEEVKEDRELVLAAVSRSGAALAHASQALRADRGIVLAALKQDAMALLHAAPELQDDKELVLLAVKACGQALEFASSRLRDDQEVVLAAMANSWRALEHASPRLKAEKAFVLEALAEHGSALLFAAPQLKEDREVVLAAVSKSGWALSCASQELRSDRACVLAAVETNPAALDFAEASLREDPEVLGVVLSGSGRRVTTPCGRGPPALLCALM